MIMYMNWWRRSSLRQSLREGASYSARVPSSQTTQLKHQMRRILDAQKEAEGQPNLGNA
jgi:hypothetical protein